MYKHPIHDSHQSPINRRSFLIASAMGAAGLSLYPSSLAMASPVFNAVEKLKNAVGALIINNTITDYITSTTVTRRVDEIKSVNNDIKDKGFKDISRSTVYALADERSYFFYPVKTEDGTNTALVFFNTTLSEGSQRVAIIAGPTLFGVGAFAADAVRNDPTAARRTIIIRTMLPVEKALFCPCPITASYPAPDVYTSTDGVVSVDYKIVDGRKDVIVKVVDNTGEETSKTYPLA